MPVQTKPSKRQFTIEQKLTILAAAEKEGFPVVARREKINQNALYQWRLSFPAYRELLHIRKQLEKIDEQLELIQKLSKKIKDDVDSGKNIESYNSTLSVSHLTNSLAKNTELKSALMKRQQELLTPAEEQETKQEDSKDKDLQKLAQIMLAEIFRQAQAVPAN